MLYVTTRIKQDAFTANRALAENRGPEGGFFLPMRMPKFDASQIMELGNKSFSQNMADIVNLLFGSELDSWGMEFAVGRYPVKLVRLSARELVAETWHNPLWRFERLAIGVEKAIRQSDQVSSQPSDWLMIASRIAVLFGVFGELIHDGAVSAEKTMDVAVPSGNFSAVMAAWYAREWGLPIGTIVICCNENGGIWNLLNKGEIRTDAVSVRTDTPACDYTVPTDLERLICAALGQAEVLRFCETCRKGGVYYLEKPQTERLRRGVQVSVVGGSRMESTIGNLYRTIGYITDPYTALVYSGLADYRARTGESRPALILSDESPAHSLGVVSRCLGLTPAELKKRIDKS